jgi:hypothetical protein
MQAEAKETAGILLPYLGNQVLSWAMTGYQPQTPWKQASLRF